MKIEDVLKNIVPCDKNRDYIFVSYSNRDKEIVWRDTLEFQRRGYNVWLDEKNLDKTKSSWKEDAIRAVEHFRCALVLFYISGNSLVSAPCYNEVAATVGERARQTHLEDVPFAAVDVEPIPDITAFGRQVLSQLRENAPAGEDLNSRAETIGKFILNFFNSNNEKVRIKAKNAPDRALDYYEDITDVFPDRTRIKKETDVTAAEPAKSTEPAAVADLTMTADEAVLHGDEYYFGFGDEINYQKAVWFYRIAADQGNADAQFSLGFCFATGKGVSQDHEEAVRYYRLAADQGNANALCCLGNCYYYGHGVSQDYEEAVRNYRLSADQGNADALCCLGNCYYYGQGVSQDYEKAVRNYRLSADQGNAAAVCCLGNCYYYGRGVPQDYEEAVRYYRHVADLGYADAQYHLGICYEYGHGVPQSYRDAVRYYRLAANQGYAGAQNNLGIFYYYGRGVPQSYEDAVQYYRLAANQGYADAQINLGNCYYSGQGVPQNYEDAVQYYRLAADQGYAELGICYEHGRGVKKDLDLAIKYYRLAAKQGNTFAAEALTRLGVPAE